MTISISEKTFVRTHVNGAVARNKDIVDVIDVVAAKCIVIE